MRLFEAVHFIIFMLFAFLFLYGIYEAISVYQEGSGYVWTTEGPFGWNYGTREIYIISMLIFSATSLIIALSLVWALVQKLYKFYALAWVLIIFNYMTVDTGQKNLTEYIAENTAYFDPL